MLFIAFHTGQSSDPLLISLGLPEGPARAARWLLLVVFFASTLFAFVKLIGRAGLRQMLAPAALMATQFLWFVLPTMLELLSLYEVPQARYSTGILAFMHSAQYLWITSYYAKRESLSSTDGRWRPFGYFAALVIGGIALFVPGPWFVSYVFKQDFSSSFLIFASLINIHHFILDGAVWKLRDPGVAENLLDKKEPAQSSQKNFSTSGAMRWVFGTRFSARALRIAAVVSLIALAGLDQAKFYLGASDSDLSRLARAEALNPYDSQVLTHKARAWSREGNLEERLASLRRAVRINPHNRQAQTTLAQALIENKRFEEAYEHYKQMARNIEADSGMYFNMGVLASQLGRDSEAIERWKKSVALDNRNSMAHLRLAEAYDLRRAYASAIEHNEQYLLLLTSNREQDAPDVESVLRVVLKLAEEYTFTEQNDRAISYYEKMATLGEKSGGLHYSSLAWSRQASLYAQMNEKNKAARCYQRALLIDAELRDAKVEGADWFNYGRFLKQSKASEQLSLACILKAEQLLDSVSSDETGAARREREAMEKSLGSEAEAVRREMELLLKEAMAFQF
jgi:tetratricopeptide (TPR) repeat protein